MTISGTTLSLDLFTRAVHDVERTQYQILAGLQRAYEAFDNKRIYPYLGQLVHLHRSLTTIIEQSDAFRTAATGTIKNIDLEDREIEYEWPELDGAEMAVVEELIRWALPHIREAVEDGRSVYEFVEDNVELETVGIVPSYLQEGYLMVPDTESSELHILRYRLSILTDDGERYRALRTTLCKTVERPVGVDLHPSSLKLELVEERRDLPNPATYFTSTAVDIPYEDTLLPVVKRRLIRRLMREE